MSAWIDRLVVAALPLVPKPIVKVVASRYVAGDTLEAALDTMLSAPEFDVVVAVIGSSTARMISAKCSAAVGQPI